MSEYKALTAKEAASRLLALEKPLVVMHTNPDGDTVGSGIALVRVLRALGKDAFFACALDIPERLSFLVGGEERVSENLENYEAVAVDVASPKQLGELEGRISPVLMIDHHEVGIPFADSYIIPGASSAAEVLLSVVDELISIGKLTLTPEIASPIYAGISSDTGGFLFSNATAGTMRCAARLIESGVNSAEINHSLFHSKSRGQIAAEGFAAANMKVTDDGEIAYLTVSKNDRESLGLPHGSFDTAIDIVRSLRGVKIAVVIKETDSGGFKASLRSVGADVASVAKSFGGGGHIRAAGCTVDAPSIEAAAEILLKKLKEIHL